MLAAITVSDFGSGERTLVWLMYQSITLFYDFFLPVDQSNNPPALGSELKVLRRIYYPATGQGYLFPDYSSYGMIRYISVRNNMTGTGGTVTDGTEIAYTKYDYVSVFNQEGQLLDSPTYTHRYEWWQGRRNDSGNITTDPAIYTYQVTEEFGDKENLLISTVTHPNGLTVATKSGNSPAFNARYGHTISTQYKDGDTLLQQMDYDYAQLSDATCCAVWGSAVNSIITTNEAQQRTQILYAYGNYGRLATIEEYGFESNEVFPLIRKTQFSYSDNQTYLDSYLLRLITAKEVYDGNNTLKAKTTFTYDNYAIKGGMEFYDLTSSTYPPNHNPDFDQNQTTRGNITGVTSWIKFNPDATIVRNSKYDIFGNVVEADVSCCQVKTITFAVAPAFSPTYYSKPISETNGKPGTVPFLTTSYEYDFNTGLLKEATDSNNLSTTFQYDPAWRIFSVTTPSGATTTTSFDKANGNDQLSYTEQITYTEADSASKTITSKRCFDGAGHVIRSGTGSGSAPTSFDSVAIEYDFMGRLLRQSNPYSSSSSPTLCSSNSAPSQWTTNEYDKLSRVKKIVLPDDQPNAHSWIQTIYNGSITVAIDQVGRKRHSEIDGLGRLVKVVEQNPATGLLDSTGYLTTYGYDALDNLISVNQGNQVRSFAYDALSRQTSETTPEGGTCSYTYTDFGALLKRTHTARGVETHFAYDALNRPSKIWHTGLGGSDDPAASRPSLPSTVAATPDTTFSYNNLSAPEPGNGQISQVELSQTTFGSEVEQYEYDNLGRLAKTTRTIDSANTYMSQYQYNGANQMSLLIYPSLKRVRVNHDARGRLSGVDKTDSTGALLSKYVSGINYNVAGQVTELTIGNSPNQMTETFAYDAQRLQMINQRVTNSGGGDLMNLTYSYQAQAGRSGIGTTAGNSGQLMSITGNINGQNRNETFTYDDLGRLATVAGWNWQRRYEYDRWGNKTAVYPATSAGTAIQTLSLEMSGGVPTNRVTSVTNSGVPLAQSYDAAGNLTSDGAHSYQYDAEGRIAKVDAGTGNEARYFYDAGNRRIKKVAGGYTTYYIWEGGVVIAEYSDAPQSGAGRTRFYHNDTLSTRMATDGTAVKGTQDHLPFGEEGGTSGEVSKHRFTNYERDGESNTDYAVNRQYAMSTGRYNQPDAIAGSGSNPQSLNRYAYSMNDPINLIDPLGLSPGVVCYLDGAKTDCGDLFDRVDSGAFDLASVVAFGSEYKLNKRDFYKWIEGPSGMVWDSQLGENVLMLGLFVFDQDAYDIAKSHILSLLPGAVSGASKGSGGALLYALAFENQTSKAGQAKLGKPTPKYPYWDRSFHFDGPHGRVTSPHFNAEFGPLKTLNHKPIPQWLYRVGSTSALKWIGRGTVVVGLGLDAYDIATAAPGRERHRAIGGAIGGWGGAAGGAAIGSLIVPGVGTVIGGLIGGFLGGWGGQEIGSRF